MLTYRALSGSSFKVVNIVADDEQDLETATDLAVELINALEGPDNVYVHRSRTDRGDDGTYSRIIMLES